MKRGFHFLGQGARALCLTAALVPSFALAGEPLRDAPVIWHEDDRNHVAEPGERDPNLLWDGINDTVILPRERHTNPVRLIRRVGTAFGGDHVPPASNINALDEVPNSSWFTNRIGHFDMTAAEAARGPGHGMGPDMSAPWTIVSAKSEGVTPGFNIRDAKGDVYVIKFDAPGYLSMSTGAGVIANRIFHACGYNTPEDAIVHFTRDDLILAEGVELKEHGVKRVMTRADIDKLLATLELAPDGTYRAISSRFLSGVPIGCFNYLGTRGDDPNDRVRHEHRRELRGLKIIAAWINHFDTKQHNSLDMYVTEGDRSYVKHYLIDFASTLGSGARGPAIRYGYEYTFDLPPIMLRLASLGFREDTWRKQKRPEGLAEVGYFTTKYFDPREFKPLQPNSAFANCTGRDAYWAAKIISSFTDEQLLAIAREGHYYDERATAHIARTLAERRDKIARAFFDEVPPIDFFTLQDGTIAFHDLGVERGLYPTDERRYRVRFEVVNEDRRGAGGGAWQELAAPSLAYDAPAVREALGRGSEGEYPFLAIEVQVNRGKSWSPSTTAYVARAGGRVVALDR